MPVKHGKYRWLELWLDEAISELFPVILAAVILGGMWLVFHGLERRDFMAPESERARCKDVMCAWPKDDPIHLDPDSLDYHPFVMNEKDALLRLIWLHNQQEMGVPPPDEQWDEAVGDARESLGMERRL